VGHFEDADVHARLDVWMRAACAWADSRRLRLARFGDNMRQVAVTEGDKVAAQRQFGYAVNGYGVGDLVAKIGKAGDADVDRRMKEYAELYELKVSKEQMAAVRVQAKIEVGLRAFLEEASSSAFTDTFEDLHGLEQLPGLAVQRLMAEGYGFGAEGDWKTAALVRALKVMGTGLAGGTSFMEDYTYHLDPKGAKVLGAHMLEVCPTIARGKPTLEVHPLSIGGKADPARLVFTAAPGPAVCAAVIDLGNRFRLVANAVDVVDPDAPLPKLPVARALWVPRPDLKVAAAAWSHAGSSHPTAFSLAIGPEHLRDFADMAGVEFVLIDEHTRLVEIQKELRWNEAYYTMAKGIQG
jgi:L-arabinose isomerase